MPETERREEQRGRGWPILVILAFLALAFGPTVFDGRLLATGDSLAYYFPIRVLIAGAWLQGVVPFWNPYAFGGMPLWAAIQGGVLFPGNLPFLLLPPVAAMNATVILAYVVAGVSTYAFARAAALPRTAAVLAALVFMGSGFMMARLEQLTAIQAGSLLPAVLWAIERFRRTLDPRYAIAGAAVVLLMILAGHPQFVVHAALLAAPYALYRGWDLRGRELAVYVVNLALMGGLAAALSLPQVLPLAEFLGQNSRARLSYGQLTTHSYDLRHGLTFLFPFLFGGHPTSLFPQRYWGIGPHFVDLTGYVGLGTLMLAVIAPLGRRAFPAAGFWLPAAIASAVLMLGAYPIYAVWHRIPVLNMMRSPGRHNLEFDLALAMLAAYGLATLLAAAPARARRLAAGGALAVAAALALVAVAVQLGGPWYAARLSPFMPPAIDLRAALQLAQPALWVPLVVGAVSGLALVLAAASPRPWTRGLLVALIAGDLYLFGQHAGFRQLAPQPGPLPPAWVRGEDRVLAISTSAFPYRDYAYVEALHLPTFNVLLGERHVSGAEGFLPDRMSRLLGGMSQYGYLEDSAIAAPAHHALDVLATREVRIPQSALARPPWQGQFAEPRWRRGPDDGALARFANPRALPRAWRVREVAPLQPVEVDRRVTSDASFDPRRVALVDADAAPGVSVAPGFGEGTATAHATSLNAIRLETDGVRPGFVVVSEGFDPGWQAWLGDQALPVHRVDGLVLGVEVPAGRHVIALRYVPRGWMKGLLVAGFAALVLAGWVVWAVWRRRTIPAPSPPVA